MKGKRVHRPRHCQYIHVNIPELLLKEFDDLTIDKFASRTAAIHEAMRGLIKEMTKSE